MNGPNHTTVGVDVCLLAPLKTRVPHSIANYMANILDGCTTADLRLEVRAPFASGISRASAVMDTYLKWPFALAGIHAGLFHIVDQGVAWYRACTRRTPVLITVHDIISYLNCIGKQCFQPPPLHRRPLLRINAEQIRRADRVIAVSEHTAGCLRHYIGVQWSRIAVIYNSVHPDFRPYTPRERTAARQALLGSLSVAIGHVGSGIPYKNRLGVIKAFGVLRSRLPSARLFLVHGPATSDEASFVASSGLSEAVRFLPLLNRRQLVEFYNAIDVLVFPSFDEGFGVPVIEAMACGCPVVSSRCGALGEITRGAAEWIIDPTDSAEIAAHVWRVLRSSALQSELSVRGLDRAKRFDSRRIASEVTATYRQLL